MSRPPAFYQLWHPPALNHVDGPRSQSDPDDLDHRSCPELNAVQTVIGFVVSYRCHSAYARYLEGSQLWCAPLPRHFRSTYRLNLLLSRGELIHLSRSFGRHIWFHVASLPLPLASEWKESSP